MTKARAVGSALSRWGKMPKVVYVTGAPAAGKSSTPRLLTEQVPGILHWEYGARLTELLQARSSEIKTQGDVRARSAGVVTPADIAHLDDRLLAFVDENRGRRPVLIDSHPVTKEEYGYRVTAFSLAQIQRLAPDEIWVFMANPEETRRRIESDAGGRPQVSLENARFHTTLQASIAAAYGVLSNATVYVFDTTNSREQLIERLRKRLS
jgi:adenylate kinase